MGWVCALHKKGGKKILDMEACNRAVHLVWLKGYLNLGEMGATWTYHANMIIGTNIPPTHKVDEDPESRIMPFLQTWETRVRNSMLLKHLRMMLKLVK